MGKHRQEDFKGVYGVRRLRIALLESGGWGGICHYTYNLSQALGGKGVEVFLLTNIDYELEAWPRNFSLQKIVDPHSSYPKNVFKLLGHRWRKKPGLLHFQSLLSPRKDWLLFLIARAMRIPLVITAHNVLPHDIEEKEALGVRLGLKLIYRWCAAVVAHSNENKDSLCREFNLPHQKVSVIPHGNYLFALPQKELKRDEARAALGLTPDEKVALCFGAIRRYKGIDLLIKAFEITGVALPRARLLIAGKLASGYAREYHSAIEASPMAGRIISAERYMPLSDLALYFSAADVAVFPYYEVGQSGSMQLAYAFSKPVVASSVGSFPETVEDGSNGYLVRPGDAKALAEALIRIFSKSDQELKMMGERSYNLARAKHDWSAIAEAHANLYRSLHSGWESPNVHN